MSQSLSAPSLNLSVYHHLFHTISPSSLEEKQQHLNLLPASLRQKIYWHIYDLAGRPAENDYGAIHAFDCASRFKEAAQRIAYETFDSLPRYEKDCVAYHIWESSGSPETEDHNWGENHAKDDVTRLLNSLGRCIGDLLPEHIKLLDQWDNDEYYFRVTLYEKYILPEKLKDKLAIESSLVTAAKYRILDSLKLPDKIHLSLRDHRLQTLPPIFDREPFVSRLEVVDISRNLLSSYSLTLLCHLQGLKLLKAPDNLFYSLPSEISRLHQLNYLNLQNNSLTNLPLEIGSLSSLEELHVDWNQLETLPPEISQLSHLQLLSAKHNTTLSGLPNDLLHLPRTCIVDLTGTDLSASVLRRLREICLHPDYQGPGIGYAQGYAAALELHELLLHFNGLLTAQHDRLLHQGFDDCLWVRTNRWSSTIALMQRVAENPPLPPLTQEELLAQLFTIAQMPPSDFPQLNSLSVEKKNLLISWLSRLSDTADYRKGGDFQKAFAKKVLGYVQKAEEKAAFRESFHSIIEDASITCGDRVSLSILDIDIAAKLHSIDVTDIKGLSHLLLKTVWPVQMLKEIARNKVPTLQFFDEIQIYLGYPVKLKERLQLDIGVDDMLFFRCSALTQKDLDEAATFVESKQADSEACCRFLSQRDEWKKALKTAYPQEYTAVEEAIEREEENLTGTIEEYELAAKNREKKWMGLTAIALRDLA